MARQQVSPGYPPLLWSNMDEAFSKINANFTELYATVGGGSVVDFGQLETNVTPNDDGAYQLGSETKRWKNVYTAGWDDVDGSRSNGLWAGDAQIKGIGDVVDLPFNSTVDGELIIDPNKTFFKSVQVDSGNQIVANEFIDVLNLNSGTAMQLVVDSAAESITINNTGVTSLTGSTGIAVSSSTGNITLTNTGVRSVVNPASLPSGRTAGAGIASNSSTGAITLTNTGILDVQGGFGITVSVDPATGIANVVNTAPAQVAFRTVLVDGQSSIVADNTADELTIDAGYGVILTTNDATDTLTITVDQNIDITGSVYSNDSTQLIDGVDGIIFAQYLQGTANINVVGNVTGNTTGYHSGDVKGSVFSDDSAKLVDAVESLIVGNVENSQVKTRAIYSPDSEDLSILGTAVTSAGDGNDVGIIGGNNLGSGDGGGVGIYGGNGGGQGGGIILFGGYGASQANISILNADIRIGDSFDTDKVTIGRPGNATNNVFYGRVDGDLTGSVFADDSTVLVDATGSVIFANYLQGTATIDVIGNVFANSSEILVNALDGTLAYYPTTAGDWNGTAPTTVGEAIDRLATLVKALNAGTGA